MKKTVFISIAVIFVFTGIYFGVKTYASNEAEKKINLALEKNAGIIDLDYKDVSVDLIGMDVRISDIQFSPPDEKEKLKIKEIIIHDFDEKSEIPSFLSVSVRGLELNPDEFGKDGENIRNLGYTDKLLVNLKADYVYEKEKRELNIKKIGIGADDVGEISVSLHISNIDLSPENFMGILFTFPQIILHKAEIVYKDDSLAERYFALEAKEKDMDTDKFKSLMIQEIEKEIEKEKNDFARNLLVKIKDFVNDPEEFSISATPESPSPLGQIMAESEKSVREHNDLFRFLSAKSDSRYKQSEAKQGLGTIAKNQEAYLAENDTYAGNLSDIGFNSKAKYYDFYIVSADQDTYKAVARSKAPGISGKGAGDDVWTMDQRLNLKNEPYAPPKPQKKTEANIQSKQSEAKQGLGTISKNQEAYFAESDTYTQDLEKIGFINKSEYYDFYIEHADKNTWKAYAKSKAPGIFGKGAGDDVWSLDQNLSLKNEPYAPKPVEKAKASGSTIIKVSDIDLHSVFRRLENAGFQPGPYQENDLGSLSEAVRRFQKFAKLDESGVIDASTWAKLEMLYDPESSGAGSPDKKK
ncbi:MAG: peptidoglycan-binding protein [Desulfococcaceae bacterium]|jgi:Tfp pilus assembly protein PilE|nr:peptidoglycan-binding protein [Desulfococcaceae bacterium]